MSEKLSQSSDSVVGRWRRKFACALRGLLVGIRGQNSFCVHIPAALAVLGLAGWLRLPLVEWTVLLLCIAIVFAAELFNSAIEQLARAITRKTDPEIRNALDIASGAVLATAIGAIAVAVLILGWPLMDWLLGA